MAEPIPQYLYRCTTCNYWWSRDARAVGKCPCGGVLGMVDMERHLSGLRHQMCVPPWTDKQVISLNEYQASGTFHPFTHEGENLVASRDGWSPPGSPNEIVQRWAWPWMADDRWRQYQNERDQALTAMVM